MLKYGESDILPTRSVLTSISRGFCDFPRGRALLTLRSPCVQLKIKFREQLPVSIFLCIMVTRQCLIYTPC